MLRCKVLKPLIFLFVWSSIHSIGIFFFAGRKYVDLVVISNIGMGRILVKNFGSLIRFYWNHCIVITCVFKLDGVYVSISLRVKWNATTSILNIMDSNYQSDFHFCHRDRSETHFCLRDQSETHSVVDMPWHWELKSLHFSSPGIRCSCKSRLSPFN